MSINHDTEKYNLTNAPLNKVQGCAVKLMQNDLNKDILFMRKAVTKELMVNSNICSYDEIESVFSEINDRYTKKWGNVFLIRHLSDLFKYSVSCAIKKHKLRSIVALKIYNYTVRIIKCLK